MTGRIEQNQGKLKRMLKKIASVAVAFSMTLPVGITAPVVAQADDLVEYYMENPHDQIHYDDYGYGTWSSGQYYIKDGDTTIGRAYCINPAEEAPQSGWRDCEIYGEGSRMRHLLYYLPGAYGYNTTKDTIFAGCSEREMAVIGHMIISYNRGDGDGNYGWYGDQDKGMNDSTKAMIEDMFNQLLELPDPPSGFTAFYIYGPNGYQSLVGNIYENPEGYIEIQKLSNNPEVTEDNEYYSLVGTKYAVYGSRADAEAGTNAYGVLTIADDGWGYNGNEYWLTLEPGTYYCKEAEAGLGFEVDAAIYETEVKATETNILKLIDKEKLGSIELQKKSTNPSISDNNRCYSLAGAVYKVTNTTINKEYEMTTDKNGYAKLENIPFGDYVVEETKASPGYEIEVKPGGHKLTISANNTTGKVVSNEKPSNDPASIEIFKLDEDSGAVAQGGASLAGAEFTVQYYDTTSYDDVESLEASETPLRTWVIQTKKSSTSGKYFCGLSDTYKVSGDEFYRDLSGNECLPVGTIVVEETKAPEGYLLDGKYLQRCDENGNPTGDKISGKYLDKIRQLGNGDIAKLVAGNFAAQSDKVKRGDINFQKKDDDSDVLARVPFKITSLNEDGEEIESHVIYTDDNGYWSSSAEYTPHSTDTNAWDNDDALDEAGIWFGIDENGESTTANDERGAFPYGRYKLEELPCEANEGLKLVNTTFRVSRDEFTVDLGTLVDHQGPAIGTTATDQDTEINSAVAKENAVIIDTVKYTGLTKGTEYTLFTKLMNKETGEAVEGVEVETTFTPNSADGTVDVEIPFNALSVAGSNVVVFEYLYENDIEVAKHEDIEDEGQTIHYPEIQTTLTEENTGAHHAAADEDVTLVDTVTYKNLIPGKAYTMTGTLMDKETGKAVKDDDGNEIKAEAEFTPDEADGTADVTFMFSGVNLAGTTTVAFENLYYKDKLVAVHADLEDEAQTVTFPKIGTTAVDGMTQTHFGAESEKLTIVDTVAYSGLEIGEDLKYKMAGELYDVETGESLGVVSSEEFVPTEATGSVDVKFEFDRGALKGDKVVVFEKLFIDGEEAPVATHEDLTDEGQTVTYPEIGTTLLDKKNGTQMAFAGEKVTLVDTVEYKGLVPGETYTLTGTLMNKATSAPVVSGDKYVTSTVEFVPEESTGKAEVAFEFNAIDLAGNTVVAFEKVSWDGAVIATHEDIEDEGQTVFIPKIGTKAIDAADGDNEIVAGKDSKITDTVAYENLKAGSTVTVVGTLMDKKTGKPVVSNGQVVTSSNTVKVEEAKGEIAVDFEFDSTDYAGKYLVVYEKVYANEEEIAPEKLTDDELIASHEDIEDEAQTIGVVAAREEESEEESKTKAIASMKTGDVIGWLVVAAAVVAGGAALVTVGLKKSKKDE